MSAALRRRVLRPPAPAAVSARDEARRQRQMADLVKCRASLKRWLSRLKRATSTVTTLYQKIRRLEASLGIRS